MQKDAKGRTPIAIAREGQHADVVSMLTNAWDILIRAGSVGVEEHELDEEDKVETSKVSSVKPPVQARNLQQGSAQSSEATPLHTASRQGDVGQMKLLLGDGTAVRSVDENGQTPLHKAAGEGRMDAVKLLIQNNAPTTLVGLKFLLNC